MCITAEQVKLLREKTGAGMLNCKKALVETKGDFDKAIEYLRQKGLASAEKKGSRITKQGIVATYIHTGSKIGVLVELNCETDFVAKNEDFQTLLKDVAMHIAAADPKFLKADEMDESFKAKEAEIYAAQLKEQGKPEAMIPNIVKGKLAKLASEVCLYEQSFVKDPDTTIGKLIEATSKTVGATIKVTKFTKFNLGEGIQKKEDNFAEEVAKMTGQN